MEQTKGENSPARTLRHPGSTDGRSIDWQASKDVPYVPQSPAARLVLCLATLRRQVRLDILNTRARLTQHKPLWRQVCKRTAGPRAFDIAGLLGASCSRDPYTAPDLYW